MRKTISVLIATLLLTVSLTLPAFAQPPPIPMTVWGYVLIQTDTEVVTAPEGLGVYAKTDTTTVTSTTTEETGKYVLKIEGPPEGTPIDLWVEDVNVTRITLHYWTVLANFNLTITAPALVADFTATPTTGDEPLTLHFTDASTPAENITSWSWDFDNDTIVDSTEQNPTHTYEQDGNYTVSLTVTGIIDTSVVEDTETKVDYITVLDTGPTADFTATPTTGTPPLEVNFTDLSTSYDGIVSWSWTFGDGGTSAEQNATHVYGDVGNYTVTLTVAEADGDTDTEEKPDYIIMTPLPPPHADFIANVTSGSEPLTVAFTDLSEHFDGIISWEWDFDNDGVTDSTEQNPTYTYEQDGVYTVSLRVVGDLGEDTETKVDYITVLDTEPTANFTATPTTGTPPLTVAFTDLSVSYDVVVSWSWAFGDGETSAEPNPTHVYEAVGTYTVTLTVSEADDSTDTEEKVDYIVVTALPPDTEPPVIVYAEIFYFVGFNAARPGHSEWMEDDVVGVGDGSTTTFSGRVKSPILPDTVVITDTVQIITDDGMGGLVGDGTGAIDYMTGEFEVTFNTAPDKEQEIFADYAFLRGEPVAILAIVTDNVAVAMVEVRGLPDPLPDPAPMESSPEMPEAYSYPYEERAFVVPEDTPPGNYTLVITAIDTSGNKATETVTLRVVYMLVAYNVWLTEGWSLISLPLIPDNSSIEGVMAGVSILYEDAMRAIAELHPELEIDVDAWMPTVEAVWAYDATTKEWLFYEPATGVGDLTKMRDGWGYWLDVSMPEELEEERPPAILTVHGVEFTPGPVTPPEYHVVPGWNLIGYKSTYHMSAGEYLRSIKGKYAKIYGYSAWAQCFYWLRDEDDMEPGYGYWIYVTEEGFIAP